MINLIELNMPFSPNTGVVLMRNNIDIIWIEMHVS